MPVFELVVKALFYFFYYYYYIGKLNDFISNKLSRHAAFFKDHVIPSPKSYYNYDSGHTPDHWFEPVQV